MFEHVATASCLGNNDSCERCMDSDYQPECEHQRYHLLRAGIPDLAKRPVGNELNLRAVPLQW